MNKIKQDNISNTRLTIKNVSKKFGEVTANDNISFDVRAGKIVGLLGPNGAGKTTLMRICAGWLAADSGSVFVNGIKQSVNKLQARAMLGIVSRDAALYDVLTVNETLHFFAALYGIGGKEKERACDLAISSFHLQDFINKKINTLSSGMLQRVAIAIAMLHNPMILLLDEPTVGLDTEVRLHIHSKLIELRERGVSMLFTTHYLEEAANLCDEIHLMSKGKIILSVNSENINIEFLKREYLRIIHQENCAETLL